MGVKWKALTPGSHPPVGRLKHADYVTRKPICPCQAPDATVATVLSAMFFKREQTDPWLIDMIRLSGLFAD